MEPRKWLILSTVSLGMFMATLDISIVNVSLPKIQVALGIDNSEEYQTDEVQQVYERFLHRAAEPGGLSGWLGFLQAGGTLGQMEALVVGSPANAPKPCGRSSGRPKGRRSIRRFLPLCMRSLSRAAAAGALT